MPMLPIPSHFRGYEIIQQLPSGLSGEVYKARYKDGSIVAIKILSQKHEKDQTVFGYFTNEIVVLRELSTYRRHPHLVEYFRDNLTTSPYYITTRFVEGSRSLSTMVGTPLPPGFVLRVVEQIGDALDYLHYAHPQYSPIIHRDVKPDNILIDATDNAVLIDLSIASHPNFALEKERGLGTPNYMAPEQYEGSELPATDQFALAAVALYMLTGRTLLPSRPTKAYQCLNQLRANGFAKVQSLLGTRQHTATVITRAMAYDPQQRYQDCQEFAYALRQALQQDGITLAIEIPRPRVIPRHIGWLAMTMVCIVALVTLALAFWPGTTTEAQPITQQLGTIPTAQHSGVLPILIDPPIPSRDPTSTLPLEQEYATPLAPSSGTIVITAQIEPLRKAQPSTKSSILVWMPRDAVAMYLGEEQQAQGITWYKVSYGEQVGWCRKGQCDLR